jgi:hypothetical protein
MKISSHDTTAFQTAAIQLARLSGPHGYRFDGDTVHLNAMFALLDPAAHERSWALQLWACPGTPSSTEDLAGHVVAEVPLPPMGELADETEHFEVRSFAAPPAGAGEYVMVLVLASGRGGQFNEVHDFAAYPRREAFIQPRMIGNVGYRIDGSRVQISVERVENPRPEGNRSGTLSLELWALPARFTTGRFQGHHLAGVEVGSINGQDQWALQPMDLAFNPPPQGKWQIVLMLREWTESGFLTRDFANFAVPFVTAPVVEKAPAKEIAKTLAPVAPAKAPAAASPKGVSVNTAAVGQLAAVKGLTPKLAEGIVKKRPFASLDELRSVKGLGDKILAKIRSSLRL